MTRKGSSYQGSGIYNDHIVPVLLTKACGTYLIGHAWLDLCDIHDWHVGMYVANLH